MPFCRKKSPIRVTTSPVPNSYSFRTGLGMMSAIVDAKQGTISPIDRAERDSTD